MTVDRDEASPRAPTDDASVAAQIGRPTRAPADVVARCSLGLPIVVRMPPVLPSGEPFPTRYWLTCPLAHRRVARIEAAGGVARYDERARSDPDFAAALSDAHDRHRKERERAMPEPVALPPRGGVGGAVSVSGVKCLHAHLADHLGSGRNPIGFEVVREVGPLECESPCVVASADGAVKSAVWREPARVVSAGHTR